MVERSMVLRTGRNSLLPACSLAVLIFITFFFTASTIFIFTGTAHAESGEEQIGIEGRIFTRHGSLLDAVAVLYKNYEDIPDKPYLVSPPADALGIFRISVPPGRYYFTAYGKVDGKEYRAFHGNNPVSIQQYKTRIGLMAQPVKKVVRTEGSGNVSGVVTFKGKPLSRGYVTAYHTNAETFKGLGVKSESLDKDGKFSMHLPPGEYVITAKKNSGRGSESLFGPPKHGDLIGYFLDNPVEIDEDEDITLEVQTYPRGDRPSFDEVTNVEYWKTEFTSAFELDALATAGIKGRISDVEGRPIQNINVLAYKTTEPVFQMFHLSHGTPHITWTDQNGEYFIPLEEPGNYYVAARDTLGNAPHRDEIYGLYQGHPMHRVSFAKGELLKDIDIVAGVTMDPSEKYAGRSEVPQFFKNKKIPGDESIREDTVWSGTIDITGVVSVERGVTLTIEPGTTVRFKKIDRDRNRIGDGEILVEGRIIAKGTPEKKIIFTSAEEEPAKLDWSYINILSTGADNIFQHCVFEYAFSGMQIHYSNVTIHDNLFWKSGEGLHFNTANLDVRHNTMTKNGVGLKFSRLEGEVLIANNLITNNDIGVQFTHQHINAVDFDNLHKYLEPPQFISNNITGNSKYNFSMGELQAININVRNNWWGETDPLKIEPSIFDKHDDEELGEVQFLPQLSTPVTDVGVRKTVHRDG